nr:hypothetical protein Iba_chr11dCG13390 [Ipomoea batatas]GME21739.1 hypothetical protein Iba_scaffold29008CG0010 [Ipomoea batatas]
MAEDDLMEQPKNREVAVVPLATEGGGRRPVAGFFPGEKRLWLVWNTGGAWLVMIGYDDDGSGPSWLSRRWRWLRQWSHLCFSPQPLHFLFFTFFTGDGEGSFCTWSPMKESQAVTFACLLMVAGEGVDGDGAALPFFSGG